MACFLLPGGFDEGVNHNLVDDVNEGGGGPTGFVAEIIGFSFPMAVRKPQLVGRNQRADVVLHGTQLRPFAAIFFPPDDGRKFWLVASADPESRVRRSFSLENTARTAAPKAPTRSHASYVFGPFGQLREPGAVWVGRSEYTIRPQGRVWADRYEILDKGGTGGIWALGMKPLVLDGVRFSIRDLSKNVIEVGPELPDSVRDAIAGDGRLGACGDTVVCLPKKIEATDPDDRNRRILLGPVRLSSGEVVRLGSQHFLFKEGLLGQRAVSALVHVRDPSAHKLLLSSAGTEFYRPNRMWNVPTCWETKSLAAGRQERRVLRLVARGSNRKLIAPGRDVEGPLLDVEARERVEEDRVSRESSHELLLSSRAISTDGGYVSLCVAGGATSRKRLRLQREGLKPWICTGPQDCGPWICAGPQNCGTSGFGSIDLGSEADPKEVLVEVEGTLLRIAPAQARRLQARTNHGFLMFLLLITFLQGFLIVRTRDRVAGSDCTREQRVARYGVLWMLQLSTIAIAVLLLVGGRFHVWVAAHQQLAGHPEFVQMFLRSAVVVMMMLSGAVGLSSMGLGIGYRVLLGIWSGSLTATFAWLWYQWDLQGMPEGLWVSALRHVPARLDSQTSMVLELGLIGAVISTIALILLPKRVSASESRFLLKLIGSKSPLVHKNLWGWFAAILSLGLLVLVAEQAALGPQLFFMVGLAWVGAFLWDTAGGKPTADPGELDRQRRWSLLLAMIGTGSIILFFFVGLSLPDGLSYLLFGLGSLSLLYGFYRTFADSLVGSRRMIVAFIITVSMGSLFSVILGDLGSLAAWLPAVLAGLFLWTVRPEEPLLVSSEVKRSYCHFFIVMALPLLLLGALDVLYWLVRSFDFAFLQRTQQRLLLAQDISYLFQGEWIARVRWLATDKDAQLEWVANLNSDIAIFGLVANLGSIPAVMACCMLMTVAVILGVAAGQSLRRARALPRRTGIGTWPAVFLRVVGLAMGMLSVLVVGQWLVHLSTGVVLRLPVTGLAFPWVSHGITTHILFTAAVAVSLTAYAFLVEWTDGAQPIRYS